jgi:riboflavin biosynthesis pyrimidine reductase
MTVLHPFETLFDVSQGPALPLPAELGELYGGLALPLRDRSPFVMGKFVTTLDGVVSLNAPGQAGGGEISGFNPHDRLLMGLLRSVADAVVVGAATLRASPDNVWTAEYICPSVAGAYRALRAALGKSDPPLNVIVTARGEIDPRLRVFTSEEVPVLIVTTPDGSRRLHEQRLPTEIAIATGGENGALTAREVIETIGRERRSEVVLVEAGPRLMGDFLAEGRLDELFLTLAPQVAGRDTSVGRPGLVSGKVFAPEHPLWSELIGVRRGGSHLFLRYSFDQPARKLEGFAHPSP